jgi:hypothetical protein
MGMGRVRIVLAPRTAADYFRLKQTDRPDYSFGKPVAVLDRRVSGLALR